MPPEEHDRALALTSHLPHLTAAALAGSLPDALRDLTATGFRDTTRVAAGDPALWSAILAQNRDAVLQALARLTDRLGAFRTALEAGDRTTLDTLLAEAKKVRDALGS
jgi:prephenate dehydrogenase